MTRLQEADGYAAREGVGLGCTKDLALESTRGEGYGLG
jgi:hypothetical protein